jgi:hypothetical protein
MSGDLGLDSLKAIALANFPELAGVVDWVDRL